jgi:hypothetical protein
MRGLGQQFGMEDRLPAEAGKTLGGSPEWTAGGAEDSIVFLAKE